MGGGVDREIRGWGKRGGGYMSKLNVDSLHKPCTMAKQQGCEMRLIGRCVDGERWEVGLIGKEFGRDGWRWG